MTKVLFVCLGNICRSPLAEALFLKHAAEADVLSHFEVDSAGTSGLHSGESADPRTRRNASAHGIQIPHKSRQFMVSDFDRFDIIYTMDRSNMANVLSLARNETDKNKVRMLLDDCPGHFGQEVPDPWFGGEEGFEQVFNLLDLAAFAVCEKLQKKP